MASMSGKSASKAPCYAFLSDSADIATAKAFLEQKGVAAANVFQGDAAAAADFLKTNGSPTVLIVDVPSAAAAPDLLNKLAEVCDPNTKVVVVGPVNEYSFYCWLMDLGISSYLLRPLTAAMLETAWTKATEVPHDASHKGKSPGRFIGFIGARGGVGNTTLSTLFTALMAQAAGPVKAKRIAIVDLDPHDGSVSLLLDLDPSRGLRESLERPDRIDNLFLERVMQRTALGFSVMGAEEPLHEQTNYHAQAADILIKELREKFDVVVLDVPRHVTPFVRSFLAVCDPVFAVSDLSLLGLRDSLRLADLFREYLRIKPPVFVVNRVGFAPRHEMGDADFKKGLNAEVRFHVPYLPEFFMGLSGDLPMLKQKKSPAYKVLEQMVASVQRDAGADGKKAGFWPKKGG